MFGFMEFRLLENAFSTQKFAITPQVKLFLRFLTSLPRHRRITNFPQASLEIWKSAKQEGSGREKSMNDANN